MISFFSQRQLRRQRRYASSGKIPELSAESGSEESEILEFAERKSKGFPARTRTKQGSRGPRPKGLPLPDNHCGSEEATSWNCQSAPPRWIKSLAPSIARLWSVLGDRNGSRELPLRSLESCCSRRQTGIAILQFRSALAHRVQPMEVLQSIPGIRGKTAGADVPIRPAAAFRRSAVTIAGG